MKTFAATLAIFAIGVDAVTTTPYYGGATSYGTQSYSAPSYGGAQSYGSTSYGAQSYGA